jgi:hypothetical protein
MAIPTIFRRQAFDNADLHVQVKTQKIPSELRDDYEVINISGIVMTVFRSALPLEVESAIQFDLPAVKRNAANLPDGGMYCWFEDLLLSQHIEVCLNKRADHFYIAADLFEVISGPTKQPSITFPLTDSNTIARQVADSRSKWWQRWLLGR